MKLTFSEEKKIAANPSYRTPARTLRKLADGHMLFETSSSAHWDRFQIRNVGLAVQRRMAGEFAGDATEIRAGSIRTVSRMLGANTRTWNEAERLAVGDLALVLALIPDLNRWSTAEKQLAVRIIRAKASADEGRYLRLMQKHVRMRAALIRIGS